MFIFNLLQIDILGYSGVVGYRLDMIVSVFGVVVIDRYHIGFLQDGFDIEYS